MLPVTAVRCPCIEVLERRTMLSVNTVGPNEPAAPSAAATPPTTTASTANITTPVRRSHVVTITHTDDDAMDAASMGTDDVVVTGPDGAEIAISDFNPRPQTSASVAVASYYLPPPGGAWGEEDNGTYTIALRPGSVQDAAGNASPGGVLGTFQVAIVPVTGTRPVLVDPQDGSTVTVSLTGPGTVAVYRADVGSNDIGMIVADGTSYASTISVRGPRGLLIDQIVVNGTVDAILAPHARLGTDIKVSGMLRRLRLGGTADRTTISVGPGRGLDASLGEVTGLALWSQSPITSLSVAYWKAGTKPERSRIDAPSIGTLRASKLGAFEAYVFVGSLDRARFDGILGPAHINVGGAIGTLTAAAVVDAQVLAGAREWLKALPVRADFANRNGSIGILTVRAGFVRSVIGAKTIGRLSLGKFPAADSGRAFGVSAGRVGSLKAVAGTHRLRLVRLDDPRDSVAVGDFNVRLVYGL